MAEQNTARAFWVREPGRGAIVGETLAAPAEGEVRVRALYSAVSRGTESLVFRGEVPAELAASMRCPHQTGEFPGPVKYGYASVGVVEAGRGAAAEALVGREILCLYPHQDRYVVPAADVVPLPAGLPAERAVLAPNLETAVNGVWDSGAGVGDRVAVVGAGVVGSLVAWLCSATAGSDVLAIDPEPSRAEVAEALGFRWAPEAPRDFEADVVVHASATEAGLCTALELAGVESRVVELSWYGARPVSVPLGGAFHPRRITIRSSQVGRLPPERAPRWDHRRRMELALRLLREPALDALIRSESAFDDLPQVLETLAASSGGDVLCHRVVYRQPTEDEA
ncbi:MAG: zinc-binding alcohol dehydrogenase [Gemmatimonadetes bacterium]|nr:zinc-binding alcohol dehydrogenase [Gemmatimonadota bacterium]